MKHKDLIGSGGKIMRFTVPVLVVGLFLNSRFPALFTLGVPMNSLRAVFVLIFAFGAILWLWSVFLISTIAASGKLITQGPYMLIRHPIYTSVGLLVIPFGGLLLNTWLGLVVGLALYLSSRKFAPEEEKVLAKTFGDAWEKYNNQVKLPWL